MWFFNRHQIHEPIALAAVLSLGTTLNIFWVANLLFSRSYGLATCAKIIPGQEIAFWLYGFSAIIFLVVWGLLTLVFRGRDCSHHRNNAFWFLVASFFIWFIMTLPPVWQFVL